MPKTERDKEYQRETYRWYKLHGICVWCHKRDAMQDRVLCQNCARKNSEHNKARYTKQNPEKWRGYMREYMRRYRQAEKERGYAL